MFDFGLNLRLKIRPINTVELAVGGGFATSNSKLDFISAQSAVLRLENLRGLRYRDGSSSFLQALIGLR